MLNRRPRSAPEGGNDFRGGSKRRKRCPFTAAGIKKIDYKDINTLSKFITERGKFFHAALPEYLLIIRNCWYQQSNAHGM